MNKDKQAFNIRKSIQTYAARSPKYKDFRVKCEQRQVRMQTAMSQGMRELQYQGRGGISIFHNFKIYCKKKELPVMVALDHIMDWFIRQG